MRNFSEFYRARYYIQNTTVKLEIAYLKNNSSSPSKINLNSKTPDTIAKHYPKMKKKILEHLKLHYREQCVLRRSLLQLIYIQA